VRIYKSLGKELSERERAVCRGLCRGLCRKQIAVELDLSEHTIKFHMIRIYRKLGVKTAAHCAAIFTTMVMTEERDRQAVLDVRSLPHVEMVQTKASTSREPADGRGSDAGGRDVLRHDA
jgi:DNA-binding CsgD family transcriptional regulator